MNKKDGTKRNKSCPVQLDILIKKVNRDTIKNDKKYLGRETPLAAVITIKGSHNHPVNDECFETLGFLRVSPPRSVYYLHDQWRSSEYGQAWSADPLSKLKEKVQAYEDKGDLISVLLHHFFILVEA